MNVNEHKFLADFQPIEFKGNIGVFVLTPVLNFVALFAVFYVAGRALKLGLGL